ncbi:hypothetical protein [Sphaerochaeta associata]|uniref:hypothetical protein n=1 Tax=Sphaerochaeta associata TaxID=1129264 RepID=UPI0024B7582F|nr:hypothetical protein [Sphaerochaeta associata]
MEHLHLAPVDGLLRQGLHRLELARPGGEDDPRLPPRLYRLVEQVGYLRSRPQAQLLRRLGDRNGNAHTLSPLVLGSVSLSAAPLFLIQILVRW